MKRFLNKTLLFIGFAVSLTLLAACGNISLASDITPPPNYRPPTEPQPVNTGPSYPLVMPDPAAGAPVFTEKCAPCHGPSGQGNGPQASKLPNPVAAIGDPKVERDASPAAWYDVVTNGRLDRFMPGFTGSLSDRQRWDVLAYVFTLSNPPAQVSLGKTTYDAECTACHGPEGKGDGPKAATLTDKVQDLTAPGFLTQKTASQLYQSITSGIKGMPAFADKLSDDQRWAVISYLRSLTFGSAPAASQASANPTLASTAHSTQPAATVEATQPAATAAATLQTTPVEGTPQTTPAAAVPAAVDSTPAQAAPADITPQATLAAVNSTPADGTPQAPSGTISGAVTLPQGKTIPEGLNVTLYGVDQNMNMVVTKQAALKADGTFVFDQVEMPTNLTFLASLDINGLTFSSGAVTVTDGLQKIDLPITVYDTSTDKSQLVIDRMHVFLGFPQPDTVEISEVFIISNPTNFVIVPEKTGQALLSFALPAGFSNLQLQGGALGQRYIQTDTGIGDTQGILPGQGQHQIVFVFDMPYTNNLPLNIPAPLPVTGVVVVVPAGGVKVQGPDLVDSGQSSMQNTNYQVYSGSNIPAGKTIAMTISGKPSAASAAAGSADNNSALVIGGLAISTGAIGIGVFVIALAGVVLWFYRRRRNTQLAVQMSSASAAMESNQDDPDTLIDAIAALDDLYRAGNLPETAYKQRRAELKERLRDSYLSQPSEKAS